MVAKRFKIGAKVEIISDNWLPNIKNGDTGTIYHRHNDISYYSIAIDGFSYGHSRCKVDGSWADDSWILHSSEIRLLKPKIKFKIVKR